MSEIAKCPECGKTPTKMVFGAGWASDGYTCCGHSTDTIKQWNKYSIAMKFTDAAIWEDECEEVNNWLDDTSENVHAYNSSRSIEISAQCVASECFEKAIKVWEE